MKTANHKKKVKSKKGKTACRVRVKRVSLPDYGPDYDAISTHGVSLTNVTGNAINLWFSNTGGLRKTSPLSAEQA